MQILFLFFCAIILFFFSGFLGKIMYKHNDTLFKYSTYHSYSGQEQSLSGNFILKTFFPCLYIVALSWILQILDFDRLTHNIWLVVVFYWLFRIFWILVIFNLSSLTNFAYEIASLLISVGAALFVYYFFIDYCIQNGISVFISRDELRSGIAFALVLYTINIIWKVLNSNGMFSRRRIYNDKIILGDLEHRTKKLVHRYGLFVQEKLHQMLIDDDTFFEKNYFITILLFSIMIVEDRNRPFLIRKFENIIHKTILLNRPMTVGIMQVKSNSYLSDQQSIIEAIKIIISVINEYESDPNIVAFDNYSIFCRVCEKYNSSYEYQSEVDYIQQTIGEWLNIAFE